MFSIGSMESIKYDLCIFVEKNGFNACVKEALKGNKVEELQTLEFQVVQLDAALSQQVTTDIFHDDMQMGLRMATIYLFSHIAG
jgi:hypothetical protein